MNQTPLRIIFFGTPFFAVPALESLLSDSRFKVVGVVTQPDKPAGRGQSMQASAIKQVAVKNDIPVFQPIKIRGNEQSFFDQISCLGPVDFCVVIAFGQILPQSLLDYPEIACVNVHASLLPRWRGAAPIQRAILAGDSESGVCIMKMEAGLDTGGVYSKVSVKISDCESASSLHDKLSESGAALLLQTLPKIASGELQAVSQPEDGITYAEKIRSSDYLIDWHEDATCCLLKIRAFSPRPGAYCFLDGKRLKILNARICPSKECSDKIPVKAAQMPGSVLSVSESGIVIQTGNGIIEIFELQLEGKKAMAVKDFIKGYNGLEGKMLDSSAVLQ